jgi:hypothetical protein
MSNVSFATWGGDLASAAADLAEDYRMTEGTFKSPSIMASYNLKAGDSDMRGNIDSYAMQKGLTGRQCGEPEKKLSLDRPLSQLFSEYYLATAGSVRDEQSARMTCFAEHIGATFTGKKITNVPDLVNKYAPEVRELAQVFMQGDLTAYPYALRATHEILNYFFHHLEGWL